MKYGSSRSLRKEILIKFLSIKIKCNKIILLSVFNGPAGISPQISSNPNLLKLNKTKKID